MQLVFEVPYGAYLVTNSVDGAKLLDILSRAGIYSKSYASGIYTKENKSVTIEMVNDHLFVEQSDAN